MENTFRDDESILAPISNLSVGFPTRRCLVCHKLENPKARIVDEDKVWLCDNCHSKLKEACGIITPSYETTAVPISSSDEINKKKIYLYAAREIATGKLVSDITNPKRKYWDKLGNAQSAVDYYNQYYADKEHPKYSSNKGKHSKLEVVKFELVEVKD